MFFLPHSLALSAIMAIRIIRRNMRQNRIFTQNIGSTPNAIVGRRMYRQKVGRRRIPWMCGESAMSVPIANIIQSLMAQTSDTLQTYNKNAHRESWLIRSEAFRMQILFNLEFICVSFQSIHSRLDCRSVACSSKRSAPPATYVRRSGFYCLPIIFNWFADNRCAANA